MSINKRNSRRFDSLNLISYECLDEDNTIVHQGIGRTINLSETGILLETQALIEKDTLIILSAALKDELVEIKGKVVHNKKIKDNKYELGIQFTEKDSTAAQTIKEFLQKVE